MDTSYFLSDLLSAEQSTHLAVSQFGDSYSNFCFLNTPVEGEDPEEFSRVTKLLEPDNSDMAATQRAVMPPQTIHPLQDGFLCLQDPIGVLADQTSTTTAAYGPTPTVDLSISSSLQHLNPVILQASTSVYLSTTDSDATPTMDIAFTPLMPLYPVTYNTECPEWMPDQAMDTTSNLMSASYPIFDTSSSLAQSSGFGSCTTCLFQPCMCCSTAMTAEITATTTAPMTEIVSSTDPTIATSTSTGNRFVSSLTNFISSATHMSNVAATAALDAIRVPVPTALMTPKSEPVSAPVPVSTPASKAAPVSRAAPAPKAASKVIATSTAPITSSSNPHRRTVASGKMLARPRSGSCTVFYNSDASTVAADRTKAKPGPGRPRRNKPDIQDSLFLVATVSEACPMTPPSGSLCMSSSVSVCGSTTTDADEVPFEASPQSQFLFVDEGNPMEKKDGRHKNCKMLQKEALAKAKRQYEQQKQQHQQPQQSQALFLQP
ncbi:MAG: hypothetical protein J3Q66DRAFT_339402 [Benniella sp.]|nr:MAG: hypothetical protein J3Q66DRAFT_339402 [Benniella sp.]